MRGTKQICSISLINNKGRYETSLCLFASRKVEKAIPDVTKEAVAVIAVHKVVISKFKTLHPLQSLLTIKTPLSHLKYAIILHQTNISA